MGCHPGLGEGQPRATSQWPQTNSTGFRGIEPPLGDQPVEQDTSFMEATTQTTSPTMSNVELTGPITPPDRTEEDNQFVLVITASIWQLNLEAANVDLGESVTASPGRDAFWNQCMAAVFSGQSAVKVPLWRSWRTSWTSCSEPTHDHLWVEGLPDDCLWVER